MGDLRVLGGDTCDVTHLHWYLTHEAGTKQLSVDQMNKCANSQEKPDHTSGVENFSITLHIHFSYLDPLPNLAPLGKSHKNITQAKVLL